VFSTYSNAFTLYLTYCVNCVFGVTRLKCSCYLQVRHIRPAVASGPKDERIPFRSLSDCLKYWNINELTAQQIHDHCQFDRIAERLTRLEDDHRHRPLDVVHGECTGSEYRRLFWHVYRTRYLRLPPALRKHGTMIKYNVSFSHLVRSILHHASFSRLLSCGTSSLRNVLALLRRSQTVPVQLRRPVCHGWYAIRVSC